MKLSLRMLWCRENEPGQPHGAVHLETYWAGGKKQQTALCGVSTAGMRRLGTPFRQWQQTACEGCLRRLEI